MVIDIHAHVYAAPRIRPSPLYPAMTFMSAEQQIEAMDRLGVDKAVILPLTNAETASEPQSLGELLQIRDRHPERFILFCNMDPRFGAHQPKGPRASTYEWWLRQYRDCGCRGVGELTARLAMDDELFMHLFAACEKVRLPVLFHAAMECFDGYGVIDDMGLPRLERVLRTFPELKIIGHSSAFWNEISGDVTPETKRSYLDTPVRPGGRLAELLRGYPNLHCDLSAESGYSAMARDDLHAYGFLTEFHDRVMLGLDFNYPFYEPRHIEWLNRARQRGGISGDVYEDIMWRNADRVLGLGIGAPA